MIGFHNPKTPASLAKLQGYKRPSKGFWVICIPKL